LEYRLLCLSYLSGLRVTLPEPLCKRHSQNRKYLHGIVNSHSSDSHKPFVSIASLACVCFNGFVHIRLCCVWWSDVVHVICSIPQSSVLKPLFLVLYMVDLVDQVAKYAMSLHAYADDTQLYGIEIVSSVELLKHCDLDIDRPLDVCQQT